MKKRILVVAAHPDDEILGCGGTIARLVDEGHEAFALILGEGFTSRDEKRDRMKRAKELSGLKKQMLRANKILGVKRVFSFEFPDNRFDAVPLLDIVKTIEKIKAEIEPVIIFTHHLNDLNVDHRVTFQAVITACRPLRTSTVKQICCFEVLSSTEWAWPSDFRPNYYVSVNDHIQKKIKALRCYLSEIKPWPHPRSAKAVKTLAEKRGCEVGMTSAEAFEIVRMIG